MTGDVGDDFRAFGDAKKRDRAKFGINCPTCTIKLPKAQPSTLVPKQRCRVCGYRDPRPIPNELEIQWSKP